MPDLRLGRMAATFAVAFSVAVPVVADPPPSGQRARWSPGMESRRRVSWADEFLQEPDTARVSYSMRVERPVRLTVQPPPPPRRTMAQYYPGFRVPHRCVPSRGELITAGRR
jgi:hypothetical protein